MTAENKNKEKDKSKTPPVTPPKVETKKTESHPGDPKVDPKHETGKFTKEQAIEAGLQPLDPNSDPKLHIAREQVFAPDVKVGSGFQPVTYRSWYKAYGTHLLTGDTYMKSQGGEFKTLPTKVPVFFKNNTFVATTPELVRVMDETIANHKKAGTKSPFQRVDVYAEMKAREPKTVFVEIDGVRKEVSIDALKETFVAEHNKQQDLNSGIQTKITK